MDELNHLYQVWLIECYQNSPHSALKDNQSPAQAFRSDKRPIRYADPKEIHEAFLHREERRVDKTGCISFYGKPYEVGLKFLGMKVTVIYDPTDLAVITVQGGTYRFRGQPLPANGRERLHLQRKMALVFQKTLLLGTVSGIKWLTV